MQVDYGSILASVNFRCRRVLPVIGLLLLPFIPGVVLAASAGSVGKKSEPAVWIDPRTVRLSRFLARLHCPVLDLADEFIEAADKNELDWRLLPSISVIESGGGKAYRNNNIFGWDNGVWVFPSIQAGLDLVASRLAHSPIYRNRDVAGKLRLYNPDESYGPKVMAVMRRISPVERISAQY